VTAGRRLHRLLPQAFPWLTDRVEAPARLPNIGVALHLEPAWVFGYLWRYLGNGGGLAVAFFALGLRGVRTGVLYGLFVCSGLLFVLVAAPYGQEMLFPLNATTVVMAVGGHIIYGAALGWIAARTSPGW